MTSIAKNCPACGSDGLFWQEALKQNLSVPDGRLRLSDVSARFVLGCEYCSETVLVLEGFEAIEILRTLQGQLEQAEARAAELEAAGRKAALHWSDAQSGYQCEDLMSFRETLDHSTGAWLLRKQAEAVEAFAEWADPHWPKSQAIMIKDDARSHAFELRQQADEAEKAERGER